MLNKGPFQILTATIILTLRNCIFFFFELHIYLNQIKNHREIAANTDNNDLKDLTNYES